MKLQGFWKILLLAGLAAMLGCGGSSDDDETPPPVNPPANTQTIAPAAVYTLTNAPINNAVRQYRRSLDGTLTFLGDFTTGGNGDGTNLDGAAGSLIFQSSTNRFYAVNAGSNTISAMILGTDGSMSIISTVSSNGVRPISVTAYSDVVYVLNQGGPNSPANISGFRLQGTQLVPIPGSSRPLSTANPDPAQIGFHTTGTILVVTERATNNIETFRVDTNGLALPGVAQGSNGTTPGGFDFTPNGLLVVAEANDFTAGAGSSSVYNVTENGSLLDLSVSVGNGQTGTGQARLYANAPFMYFTNAISNTVTAYTVDLNGTMVLQGTGNAGATGRAPADLGVSYDGLYLYTLDTVDDRISTFNVNSNGTLVNQNRIISTPPSAVGMVVR